MDLAIQLGSGFAMLGISGGMIFYEYVRGKAGRPIKNNERLAILYWMTYLSLILLGLALIAASWVHR